MLKIVEASGFLSQYLWRHYWTAFVTIGHDSSRVAVTMVLQIIKKLKRCEEVVPKKLERDTPRQF